MDENSQKCNTQGHIKIENRCCSVNNEKSGNNNKEGIYYGSYYFDAYALQRWDAMAAEANAYPISEKKKNLIMDQLWLTYFNDSLYKNGVITESEHNRMRVIIKNRSLSIEKQG